MAAGPAASATRRRLRLSKWRIRTGSSQEVQHGPAHTRGTPPRVPRPRSPRYRLAQVIKAMIAALLGGSWFAYHTIEFHVPALIVEALLPRLQAAF
jgi:hypothetical protein